MTARIDMGTDPSGRSMELDLEELLATRLLVQGNSGSGKSHLLRRLLEGSAALVQQVVIDPEGDFVTLADAFGHVAVDAAQYSLAELSRLALRVREHRASVVLNLEGLDVDEQMRSAASFLSALFDAPREHWYPVLVVVDEAQLFAPAAAGDVGEDARRLSLAAMTNLMCRGRKRGLAGVIATQRLAKLAKNVAAEASNFLMGRTFLDIDMARAADLLGMDRRQAEVIRDLERGEFLALGPAIARRPVSIRIGAVTTTARSGSPKLVPLPTGGGADVQSRLFASNDDQQEPPALLKAPAPTIHELVRDMTERQLPPAPEAVALDEDAVETVRRAAVAEIVEESSRLSLAQLYQDYGMRCRLQGVVASEPLDQFRRRLAMASAGLDPDQDWESVWSLAAALPDDMWAPFLALARAAQEVAECPDDARLAELYGTSSPRRALVMLERLAATGLIAIRVDVTGRRTVSLPHLGWVTKPASPSPSSERAGRRVAARRG
jgi:hypothetical protein